MLTKTSKHTSCKNQGFSHTEAPKTARKPYSGLYKKCVHSDFGIVSYLQERSRPHSRCLVLLTILLWVSNPDVDHGNLLVCIYGASKNGQKVKKPSYRGRKITFLKLEPTDLSGS